MISIAQTILDLVTKKVLTALVTDLGSLFNTASNQALTSAGLVITGAGGTTAKFGASIWYALAGGQLVTKAAAAATAALSGTVANATFNVFCYYCDSSGVITTAMGVAGTTLALVEFPVAPANKALAGFVIINPTGTGPFVGGTTAIDDATVVPNAVFVSPTGGFNNEVAQSVGP